MTNIRHYLYDFSNKESKFWSWFTDHLVELNDLDADSPIIGELHERLLKVHKTLVFEVTPKNENGLQTFVVSCDGIQDGVSAVEKLVASAPPIENWQVVAFRPAIDESLTIEMDDIKLSSDDILFDYQDRSDDRVDLKLYTKGFDENNRDKYMRACFILLDAAIGEYAVMTKIGIIDLLPTPPTAKSLQPLMNLASVLR